MRGRSHFETRVFLNENMTPSFDASLGSKFSRMSLAVLEDSVGEIHIMGGVEPGEIVRAIEEEGAVGTTLCPDP